MSIGRFILVFITLCTIHFWGYLNFKPFFRLMDLVVIGVGIYGYIFVSDKEDLRFRGFIKLYLLGTILNIISAFFNHDQGIKDSLICFFPFYFILFYFTLHYLKPKTKDLENLILALAVLYAFIYLFQEEMYPKKYFDGAMYRDRGTIRMRIEGGGFIMLGYFLSLNKYLLQRKIKFLILCGLLFLITLKGGFRSISAACVLLTTILYLKQVNYSARNYLLVFVAIVAIMGIMQYGPTATIIDGMINATEKQQEDQDRGKTDIREITWSYFTQEYPENLSYYIVGGGIPGAFGEYGYHMIKLHRAGIFWVDLGIIGFYYVLGLVMLLGMMGYAIKAVFTKVPASYVYLNFYFAFLVLVSFITMEIYRVGMFGVEAIVLYLIDTGRNEKLQLELLAKNNEVTIT